MLSKLKSMPVVFKVFMVFLLLVVIYKVAAAGSGHVASSDHVDESRGEGRGSGDSPANSELGSTDNASEQRPNAPDSSNTALAQFQSQQTQLQARVAQCEAQMTLAMQQTAANAANGVMMNNQPACAQYMPQWTAQEAYLETEIYRLRTGDTRSSVREITGVQAGSAASPSSASADGPRSDDGTDAVENYDRQAIRGNSLYTDDSGGEHELPTRSYYFRDRSSGQIVGSDQPNAPQDGRDYEQLQGSPRQ